MSIVLISSFAFLYINNIQLKRQIGEDNFNLLGITIGKLNQSIMLLEADNLDKQVIDYDLFELSTVSISASYTHGLEFLDLKDVVHKVSFEKLFTDKEHREGFVKSLKKYHEALKSVFNDGQDYSIDSTEYRKNRYDYFRERPVDRVKYKTRAEEVFYTKFNG